MTNNRVGLLVGILGAVIAIAASIYMAVSGPPRAVATAALESRLNPGGPLLLLATSKAEQAYGEAIALAGQMHPGSVQASFDPARPGDALASLPQPGLEAAMIFICPDELDVNVVWAWLTASTCIDDDPFVDIRSGFMTGESPEHVTAFLRRIADAATGRLKLPGKMTDNLGANPQAGLTDFQHIPSSIMIPVYAERMGIETISHGPQGFSTNRLDSMAGAGLLHFGGHGYPERIVDSLNGVFVRRLDIGPAVVFNGACYTGVTGRWFDVTTGKIQERRVEAPVCFALGILARPVVGYLAALHPDHGIPVYQEMEFLAWSGESLGEAMKQTYDAVVLGNGGILPDLPPLQAGASPNGTPKDVMLRGTAARVLFGDPTFVPMASFTLEPFTITVNGINDTTLAVTAVLRNPALKATFTNTFQNDLSGGNPFNDRARIVVDLPPEWSTVTGVTLEGITAGVASLTGAVVGYATEFDRGRHRLHVQVDVPSTGYQAGPLRAPGTTLRLSVSTNPAPGLGKLR